jgi:hypothetical protein
LHLEKQLNKEVIALTVSYGIMENMFYLTCKLQSMGNYFCADFIVDYMRQTSSEYVPLYIFRTENLI